MVENAKLAIFTRLPTVSEIPKSIKIAGFSEATVFVELAYVAENVDDTEIVESADFAGTAKSVEIADNADFAGTAKSVEIADNADFAKAFHVV